MQYSAGSCVLWAMLLILACIDPLWSISVWWRWWICSSAWLDTDVFWCGPGQDGSADSQLQFDRAVMSCRQHSLLTILMMTTDPYTLISLCTLCTTNAWERINDSVFPLYKHSSSFQLVSEGRFWLGPDTRWRKKNSPLGSRCVNFPQAILQKALSLDESANHTLFQNSAFTAFWFRFTSCAEV